MLAILATLQYRWLGRVSAGERKLMQTNLQIKARGFCEEFDREITRTYAAFKMDADTLRDKSRNTRYAERFEKWAKNSAHPGIIKNVFLAEASGEGGRFNLLHFDEAKKRFEPSDWTSELESLRRDFEQQQNPDSASKKLFSGGADSIAEEIPALVSSIASVKIIDAKTNRTETDWQHPVGHVIVTLDFNYIRKEFFPALAKSYFVSGDVLDYNLTVISRSKPKKLIYQSNPESEDTENSLAVAEETAADASSKLFNISFSEVKSFSSERVFDGASTGAVSNQAGSGFTLVIPALKENKAVGDDDADKILLVDDSARWELKVNHRLGSLDTAVEWTRRWNLLASFGILLLLAVSVIMIAVLSRRSQKLARRQIAFVAGVSHEFRNPLAVIYSLSENLAAGRIRDNRQVELYGATIHKDVRRLTEMVEQILEFAGAERGRYFYDRNPLDAGDLIEKILAANVSSLQESGWSVEKRIESALPLVSADESALTRAIQNLLDNAIKYGNANQRLKVEVFKSADTHKPEVIIVVEDEGDGISPEDLPHVFEPFYRGREAVDAQIHGSGLGLNLVKKIIEAHNGKAFVESADGRGSRFIIRLPAAIPAENI